MWNVPVRTKLKKEKQQLLDSVQTLSWRVSQLEERHQQAGAGVTGQRLQGGEGGSGGGAKSMAADAPAPSSASSSTSSTSGVTGSPVLKRPAPTATATTPEYSSSRDVAAAAAAAASEYSPGSSHESTGSSLADLPIGALRDVYSLHGLNWCRESELSPGPTLSPNAPLQANSDIRARWLSTFLRCAVQWSC